MSSDGDPDRDKKDWRAAVDLRIVTRCERHTRNGERMLHPIRIRTWAQTPKTHVSPEEWGIGYLKEPREVELPLQLVSDLRDCSPQALLRDLYRPVHQNSWHHFETIEGTVRDPLGGMAELRKARMISTAPPRVDPAVREVIAYQRWRIGMMRERWQPVLADDAPRRSNVVG